MNYTKVTKPGEDKVSASFLRALILILVCCFSKHIIRSGHLATIELYIRRSVDSLYFYTGTCGPRMNPKCLTFFIELQSAAKLFEHL